MKDMSPCRILKSAGREVISGEDQEPSLAEKANSYRLNGIAQRPSFAC
jgi:hypothetical protein